MSSSWLKHLIISSIDYWKENANGHVNYKATFNNGDCDSILYDSKYTIEDYCDIFFNNNNKNTLNIKKSSEANMMSVECNSTKCLFDITSDRSIKISNNNYLLEEDLNDELQKPLRKMKKKIEYIDTIDINRLINSLRKKGHKVKGQTYDTSQITEICKKLNDSGCNIRASKKADKISEIMRVITNKKEIDENKSSRSSKKQIEVESDDENAVDDPFAYINGDINTNILEEDFADEEQKEEYQEEDEEEDLF